MPLGSKGDSMHRIGASGIIDYSGVIRAVKQFVGVNADFGTCGAFNR
jgi:hypothetical protein